MVSNVKLDDATFAALFPGKPSDDEMVAIVDQARRDTRYQITDYPVELLVSKFREDPRDEGDIYIPPYQRQLRWTERSRSYFIESVLIRIPVPPIFLYELKGQLEVVDGSQRIRTLVQFVNNEFALSDLQKLDAFNSLRYSDLPGPVQKRFMNTSIRSFVLDEGTDQTTRVEMFRRLNTTGKKLHDAEVRKGAYQGPFLDLILQCADSDLFKELTPRISRASDPASERQELITRFFVYSQYYQDFRHDVQRFLDEHLISENKSMTARDLRRSESDFASTMSFIRQHCKHAFYRTPGAAILPRVRFEAVSVGACLALRTSQSLAVKDLSWLWGTEINQLVRTDASNSGPRLRARIEYVRDRFLNG